jgi:hypothetical protein
VVKKHIHLFLGYSFEDIPYTQASNSIPCKSAWFTLPEALKVIGFTEDHAFLEQQLSPMMDKQAM